MTKREELEREIVSVLEKSNIQYNSSVVNIPRGKYRSVTFLKDSSDVEVKIFNNTFFVVRWTASVPNLPFIGQEKIDSLEKVKNFILENFT